MNTVMKLYDTISAIGFAVLDIALAAIVAVVVMMFCGVDPQTCLIAALVVMSLFAVAVAVGWAVVAIVEAKGGEEAVERRLLHA